MKLFTLEADLKLNAGDFNTGVERASIKIARMKEDMEGAASQAENTSSRMDVALGTAIGDFIGKMAGALTDAVFEWTSDGIALASSMEETNAKINTIFGDNADSIHKWAKTTKESFGIGELTAKNYAAQVAGILDTDSKNLTTEEIQNISTSLVELAGDLASFHNMSFDDVFGKLMSGLRGETEAIEALGIDLRAANLAEAFGMTSKEWGNLDQRTRLLNTYQYIMQETATAQGDFARTSDSYANQMRVFEENINSLKQTLGEGLLPVMTDLVSWFNTLFGSQEEAANSAEGISNAYIESYASIEQTTANALALVEALDSLSESTDDASSSEKWSKLVAELGQTIPGLGQLIGNETGKIQAGAQALKDYVLQWDEAMKQLAQKKALADMQESLYTMEAEMAKLETEQWWSETRKTGAKEAMGNLGAEFLNIMLEGMKASGASKSDIDAMQAFGALGAENLLARIAGGGDASLIMSALLQGGDIWKNKSFMEYFLAGGGTEKQLELMSASYGKHEETYDQYNVDYVSQIAELSSQVAEMTEKYNAAIERLAESEPQYQDDEKEGSLTKTLSTAAEKLSATAAALPGMMASIATAALNGAKVQMDGQEVGELVLPTVAAGIKREVMVMMGM